MKSPKIIYILGYGRSGSTLFNQVLGSSKNSVSVGEILFLRNKLHNITWWGEKREIEKNLCDCGPLYKCDFWNPVLKNIDREQIYNHFNYSKRYFKTFNYLYFNLNKDYFSNTFNDYKLYSNILKQSNTEIVVDSSKNLNRLIFLKNNPKLDVKVLYLTRDGRAVINSKERDNVFWPRTFVIWLINNILMRKFVKKIPQKNKLEISYDKFVQNPEKYLKQINEKFGTKIDLKNYINDVNNTQYHNFSGNAMRKRKLESIKYDKSWKKRMSKSKQILLTTLCYIPNNLWVYNKK